jgi:hypothetical protein
MNVWITKWIGKWMNGTFNPSPFAIASSLLDFLFLDPPSGRRPLVESESPESHLESLIKPHPTPWSHSAKSFTQTSGGEASLIYQPFLGWRSEGPVRRP